MEFDKISLIKIARAVDPDFFSLLTAKIYVDYWVGRVFGVPMSSGSTVTLDRRQLIAFIAGCRKLANGTWILEDFKIKAMEEIDYEDLFTP